MNRSDILQIVARLGASATLLAVFAIMVGIVGTVLVLFAGLWLLAYVAMAAVVAAVVAAIAATVQLRLRK